MHGMKLQKMFTVLIVTSSEELIDLFIVFLIKFDFFLLESDEDKYVLYLMLILIRIIWYDCRRLDNLFSIRMKKN